MNYKEANFKKITFKNLTKYSLFAASLILLGNLFHSLGAKSRKEFSPYIYIYLWLFGMIKN